MKTRIKVLLVDDHQIIRDGLSNMLSEAGDIEVCEGAADITKALEIIRKVDPDVVITDLSMPGKSGIELIRRIQEKHPGVHVLVLSMYVTEDYIFNSLKAGAKGYLPKQDTTKAELLKAIRTVARGEEFFSPAVAQVISKLYSHSVKSTTTPEAIARKASLTSRETEILRLYTEGLSNMEIADRLSISIRTVETHKNNIMQKYNFKSTVDMVKFAIRNNLGEA
ncbi:MAG: response regulator transcription factor [Bacteroidetes bacterium]|nr:response regulator transcription factor [Bacteroidota bacterium]